MLTDPQGSNQSQLYRNDYKQKPGNNTHLTTSHTEAVMPPTPLREDQIYAQAFASKPWGHALYKPYSTTQISPGQVGYFDAKSNWQVIVDLSAPSPTSSAPDATSASTSDAAIAIATAPTAIPNEPSSPPTRYAPLPGGVNLSVTPPTGDPTATQMRWPVLASEGIHRVDLSGGLSVSTPALPAGGGLSAKWSSSREHGAILLTCDPVIERKVYIGSGATASESAASAAMCKWLKTNAKTIVGTEEGVKEKGVWLVTKTYHVPRCAIGVFQGKGTEKGVSGNVNVAGAGEVEVGVAWFRERRDAGWVVYENEADGVVLFMEGIYWIDKWYSRRVRPVQNQADQRFLGGHRAGDLSLSTLKHDTELDIEKPVVEFRPKIVGTHVHGVKVG